MTMSGDAQAALGAASPVALLFPEFDAELATTRKFLALVPMEHAEWRPHGKSMTLVALAAHVAQLPDFGSAMIAMDVLHFNPADFKTPPIASTADLVALFDASAAKLRGLMAGLDLAKLAGEWRMMMGPQEFVRGQRAFLLRSMFVNHLVHHRAQLGVYLRMLDVQIPGSYGPSADTM
jgi:uncharacterized damage-inducible protein DinB